MWRWVAWLGVLSACALPGELTIERVEPSSGRSVDTVPVQIDGANFHLPITSNVDNGKTDVGGMAVSIGDVSLVNAVWRDSQLIEGAVPAGLPSGTYPVSVTLGDHSDVLPDAYTVISSFGLPLVPPGLAAPAGSSLVLEDGATIDTTTNTITGAAPGSTYDARDDDAATCAIAFIIADKIEIAGRVRVTGTRSIALIAQSSLVVDAAGVLDGGGMATQGGPGGWSGGLNSAVGGGPGGGGLGTFYTTCCDSGAGGAGYSGVGGGGGTSSPAVGGAGGGIVAVGLDRLCGGSGGGGSSGTTITGCPDRGGAGAGGGGGGLLGSYETLEVDGAVTAGGAGGRGSPGCGAGGGGGAGGTVVLASPAVTVSGVVAANGGGGGAGGDPTPGDPGQDGCACSTPAHGGTAYTSASSGGDGGAGTTLGGTSAAANPNNGGGGGGAVGRIFIATAPMAPPTLTGVLSPAATTSAVTTLDLPPGP